MSDTVKIPLIRYLTLYGIAYIAGMVIIAIISTMADKTLPGMSIFISIASAQIVVSYFFRREMRPINDSDRKNLVRGSLIVTILLDIIPALVFLIPGVLTEAVPNAEILDADAIKFVIIFTAVVLLIMWTVNYFLFRWIYGSWARIQFKAHQKKHGSISDIFE